MRLSELKRTLHNTQERTIFLAKLTQEQEESWDRWLKDQEIRPRAAKSAAESAAIFLGGPAKLAGVSDLPDFLTDPDDLSACLSLLDRWNYIGKEFTAFINRWTLAGFPIKADVEFELDLIRTDTQQMLNSFDDKEITE